MMTAANTGSWAAAARRRAVGVFLAIVLTAAGSLVSRTEVVVARPLAQAASPAVAPEAQLQRDALLGEAFALFQAEDTQGALAKLNQVLTLTRQDGDRVGEAEALFGLGLIDATQQQTTEALAALQQAITIWNAVGNSTVELEALQTIGALYSTPQQFATALDFAQQVRTLARSVGETATEAAALDSLAFLYQTQSEYTQSLQASLQALELARHSGDRAGEATALSNAAAAYLPLGQLTSALDALQQALALARQLRDRVNEEVSLVNLGAVYQRLGQDEQALAYYQTAQVLAEDLGDPVTEGVVLTNLGFIYLAGLGQPDRAQTTFQQALALARQLGDRSIEATALGGLGAVASGAGQFDLALRSFQQELTTTREAGDRAGQAIGLAGIGSVKEQQGDLGQALDSYQQAIAVQEAIRTSARLAEFKAGLAAQAVDVYQRATLVLLALGRPAEAFELMERGRARSFLDQLGNAHLAIAPGSSAPLLQQEQTLRRQISGLDQSLRQERARPPTVQDAMVIMSLLTQLNVRQSQYTDLVTQLQLADPETASLISLAPLRLADVQKLLDPNTTLLSYLVTPDKTLAFLVTQSGLQEVDLPVKQRDLEAVVANFRAFTDLGPTPPESLQQLSAWLVAPLAGKLTTATVGISPSGVLNDLPFAALSDGQQYFGDRHTLFELPSASVLPFIQEKRKGHDDTILALGQGHAPGFPDAPFAESEAQAVAALYTTQALTGGAATETAFKEQAPAYNVLHLAAHGALDPSTPLLSRIYLSPDRQDDGQLDVQEVYSLNLANVDLAVLSACATQLGGKNQGEDFVALNRAFIYAGSPSVIASLWAVNDQATSVLMTTFYTYLRAGMSKAAALQAAQADTRAQFPNPYYWAAFVLTGDPGSPG
ncbi:MAG: CHAT domain-containing protein [Dehalococcoidia bacterium]